jgi:hypothetical protein
MNRATLFFPLLAGAALMSCSGAEPDPDAAPNSLPPVEQDSSSNVVTDTSSSRSNSDTADAPAATSTTTTTPLPSTSLEFETNEGWEYAVGFEWKGLDPHASPEGCFETPPPGRNNLWFELEVRNRVPDRAAPGPFISVRSNLTRNDEVFPSDVLLDPTGAVPDNTRIIDVVLSPNDPIGNLCSMSGQLTGDGTVPPAGTVIITGVLGDIPDPPPMGLTLVVETAGPFEPLVVPYE